MPRTNILCRRYSLGDNLPSIFFPRSFLCGVIGHDFFQYKIGQSIEFFFRKIFYRFFVFSFFLHVPGGVHNLSRFFFTRFFRQLRFNRNRKFLHICRFLFRNDFFSSTLRYPVFTFHIAGIVIIFFYDFIGKIFIDVIRQCGVFALNDFGIIGQNFGYKTRKRSIDSLSHRFIRSERQLVMPGNFHRFAGTYIDTDTRFYPNQPKLAQTVDFKIFSLYDCVGCQ